MASYTIKESGGDYSSIAGFLSSGTVVNGDDAEIQGTWSSADTSAVTWNKNVTITADSDSKQPGRPWESGDTHYRLRVSSGHVFTVSANVDITDVDIQSTSTTTSHEIFRVSGGGASTFVAKNCLIGFSTPTDQQDGLYMDSGNVITTITFEQCMFYGIYRSIIDDYFSDTTWTINFNSCAGYDISGSGQGRASAGWVGIQHGSGTPTQTVNAHNCLLQNEETYVFSIDQSGSVFNVSVTNCITNESSGNLSQNADSETTTGTSFSHTWADADSGAGNYVVLEDITSSPYDQRLQDLGNTKNKAQEMHSTQTGSGLTIPATDIVGTSRNTAGAPQQGTNFDCGPFEIVVAGGGGGMMPQMQKGNLGNDLFDGTLL